MYYVADFARTKGATDKQPRKKRSALKTVAKTAATLGTGAAIGAGLMRYGINPKTAKKRLIKDVARLRRTAKGTAANIKTAQTLGKTRGIAEELVTKAKKRAGEDVQKVRDYVAQRSQKDQKKVQSWKQRAKDDSQKVLSWIKGLRRTK